MDIEIKILQSNDLEDFNQLLTVFDIVFEYEFSKRPDDQYLKGLLQKDHFMAVVARANEKVVAGLTAYVLDQYHSDKRVLYINDLAVLEEYQRKELAVN